MGDDDGSQEHHQEGDAMDQEEDWIVTTLKWIGVLAILIVCLLMAFVELPEIRERLDRLEDGIVVEERPSK